MSLNLTIELTTLIRHAVECTRYFPYANPSDEVQNKANQQKTVQMEKEKD